jgi:hypothetical protein
LFPDTIDAFATVVNALIDEMWTRPTTGRGAAAGFDIVGAGP